jgi:hypothetical protein
MSYGTPDVYYQPEAFDLEPVCEIDYSDGSYQFDLRVIWRHKPTGKLYTGRDSGCSCPSPFEDFTNIEDLDPFDADFLVNEATKEAGESYYGGDDTRQFIDQVRRLAENRA